MQYKETVVRGEVQSEHLMQLFDNRDSLADAVSSFLASGVLDANPVFVVCTPDHWRAIAAGLDRHGVPVEAFRASGHITVADARDTLSQFMSAGFLDPAQFHASVGTIVKSLARPGTRLRVYGEIVNLLAAEGDFAAAKRLEELWNELSAEVSFTLFCGYSAEHFGDPRSAEALRNICGTHSHIRTDARDLLGNFLLHAYACRAGHARSL